MRENHIRLDGKWSIARSKWKSEVKPEPFREIMTSSMLITNTTIWSSLAPTFVASTSKWAIKRSSQTLAVVKICFTPTYKYAFTVEGRKFIAGCGGANGLALAETHHGT